MIGKTFNYIENKVKITRKVTSEYYQYGKRIYIMIDPARPDIEITALADEIDKRFKVTPGKIKPRHKVR